MMRLLRASAAVVSSRAVTPLVIGFFFLLYIGIAFFTDETLISLMAFTRRSVVLAALLALIPLNYACRIVRGAVKQRAVHRIFAGKSADYRSELFDETVELCVTPSFRTLEMRLISEGYKTRRSEATLAAWRGIGIFPARMLYLAATFCLFAGILVSITTRTSHRQMVIEGEPLPMADGSGGRVERIILANATGAILSRTLTMEVAPSNAGHGKRIFGLYPPSLYGGAFVYPRYLGLALLLHFYAPDMPAGYEKRCILNCYPPGKEASEVIPGSPYRIVFSIPEPAAGSDRYLSYMAENRVLRFKLLKGNDVLFTGSAPGGGEFAQDGYRLAFPEIRRLVVTDYIGDYGVLFIWAAALFFAAAVFIWLPIRAFWPRREMLFMSAGDVTRACSRAEGGARRHAGVFHEALDLVAAGQKQPEEADKTLSL